MKHGQRIDNFLSIQRPLEFSFRQYVYWRCLTRCLNKEISRDGVEVSEGHEGHIKILRMGRLFKKGQDRL